MTQAGKEMMVVRGRGIPGTVNDGVAPGQCYRDFLQVSCFGISVSGFRITYWHDELIDEISV
jgi:hypothetical protein